MTGAQARPPRPDMVWQKSTPAAGNGGGQDRASAARQAAGGEQ